MSKLNFDLPVTRIDGTTGTLAPYQGQVLLIVNTASECGFTPQYTGLQALWQQHRAKGLAVLAFPCNQFGKQEPGAEDEIASFCQRNHGVDFPLFAKVDVNGKDAHPLFTQLKKAAPGLLGSEAIKWNFTKFLVGRDGTVLGRYSPRTTPEELTGDIERALAG